ncbi:SAM-dependent methyltransferase [Streptomyces griseorubiginosus]|uniref:SAM-dependent methyltransferase n=1 Tax=Streptomyces griseorubiginosus TaxID=67304 RepID=UPI002E80C988|nr:methyltransferase domain-containing protein [Streptomyces griseorubiginosus]WUB44157.1 methyltransferase domain-containing protein [Streptomyces griseorubiginosus]WUB52675.1 methyltransferase domain-containing protein [Streptomyces griseorubiginosus]
MPDDITSRTSNEDLTQRLTHARYPRSNSYDVRWVIDNQMGPNALWLLEWLAPALGLDTLRPGARVLDLGCGRAMTSVFLAREYDVQVTAADLWVRPDENAQRITEAGFADRVLPVHAEAHDLPFAEGSFDAIVSIDAYQYFGTNDLYLPTLTRLLKPGGRIGIVVPAFREEPEGVELPEHIHAFGDPGFWAFHTADWWRRNWTRTGVVDVEEADWLSDGWRDWLLWSQVCAEESPEEFHRETSRRAIDMLRVDEGRHLGFVRVVGRRK